MLDLTGMPTPKLKADYQFLMCVYFRRIKRIKHD